MSCKWSATLDPFYPKPRLRYITTCIHICVRAWNTTLYIFQERERKRRENLVSAVACRSAHIWAHLSGNWSSCSRTAPLTFWIPGSKHVCRIRQPRLHPRDLIIQGSCSPRSGRGSELAIQRQHGQESGSGISQKKSICIIVIEQASHTAVSRPRNGHAQL